MKVIRESSRDISRYLVYKSAFYGDTITNLKLQKLLYYVYVWYLVLHKKNAFSEKFQAWPIGPVLPSVYKYLSEYKADPIDPDYSGVSSEAGLKELENQLGQDLVDTIGKVFDAYGSKTAFELVNMTHDEFPWKHAREGLDVYEKTSKEITDEDIISFYGERVKKKK